VGDGPVLVTGATGFIGRRVVDRLLAGGASVARLDGRWSTRDELDAFLSQHSPASCVHLGWYAAPQDYLVSVAGNARSLADTLDLVELLDAHGTSRLVVAGTSAEYAPSSSPMVEDGRIAPVTIYGSAKALCHELLQTVRRPRSLTVTWTRLFNVIGPGEQPGRVLHSVVQALEAGKPVDLSEGTQLRDYVDVRDTAAALVQLLQPGSPAVVNVGTGTGRTLRELLETVGRQTQRAHLLRFGARPRGPADPDAVVADVALLRATGWRPERDTDETVRDVLQHYRDYDA
jgi:nucleoside-diphosphate-sugar epimerase